MRVKTTYFFLAFLLAVSGTFAQKGYINNVAFNNQSVVKEGDKVTVYIDIALDDLHIKSNDVLILTPVIQSEDNTNSVEMAPLFVTGRRRAKVLHRNIALGNKPAFDADPLIIVPRKNRSKQSVSYKTSIPFSNWMTNSSLIVKESVRGCAGCNREMDGLLLAKNLFPIVEIPTYQLTYIVPIVEPVKVRTDIHTATFNYVVGKFELLHDYKNNAAEFRQVDKVVSEASNNGDINITEFTVSGYASPEGGFDYNRTLATNRANSFAEYLNQKHGINKSQLKVEGFGEDWDGLRKAVATSSLIDKNEVLRIIDNVSNPDARDAALMQLSDGQTYQSLLNSYYPPLRRTDYTIAYNVRPFDVDEAREIIKTNPKHLSLNEMYLVAQTYDAASKDFKEVFDIAARMYPDDTIAIVNCAAADIESGDNQSAIDRLNKIETNEKAWNNLGVAYALKGDFEKALQLFSKASLAKDADAVRNLEKLKEYMELIE